MLEVPSFDASLTVSIGVARCVICGHLLVRQPDLLAKLYQTLWDVAWA